MKQRYLSLSLILLAMVVVQDVMANLYSRVDIAPLLSGTQAQEDPESRLARGGKIPLRDADLFALELVPGIGDGVGNKILAYRDDILRYGSFEVVPGIGEKKARTLEEWLTLD